MDEPSEQARDVLAAYKRARAADAGVHARVRGRVATSIEARVVGDTRRTGNAIALALFLAAALVLVFAAVAINESRKRVAVLAPSSAERTAVPPARESASIATPPAELPATTNSERTSELSPHVDAPTVRRAPPERETAATPDLQRELEMLQKAKRLRDAKDSRGALAALTEHAREFPRGQLAEERQAIAIEIRCKTAERPRAQADLEGFARTYSLSTHLTRLRRACE
jgi:hypothetical protein